MKIATTKAHRVALQKAFIGIDRIKLAKAVGSSYAVITQYAGGFKLASPKRALKIEKVTDGMIPAKLLRPDIFDVKL